MTGIAPARGSFFLSTAKVAPSSTDMIKSSSAPENWVSDVHATRRLDARASPPISVLYAEAERVGISEPDECAHRRAYEIGREGFAPSVGLLELRLR